MKHQARKRFGQNFLQDESVIARMLAAMKPERGERVVEVGPGLGALTLPLLDYLDTLRVVEIDRDLIARLQARKIEQLTIIEGDVLRVNWFDMSAGNKLRIVGNLPYNIGTPLLLNLLEAHPVITDVHVMLQREVVERLSAKSSTRQYGRISVLIQSVFAVSPLFSVPPQAFEPAPKVDSAIVRLKTRVDAPAPTALRALQSVTRLAFANKRKTLRNNFRGHLDENQLQKLDIDPQARAETLSEQDFWRLAEFMN